jgi:transposase
MIAAYREPDRTQGRHLMTRLINSISHNVPAALSEVVTLGRTLTRRAGDILAYFDRPGTSNGPTEAINGRLEHLRGTALGFRNLTNYVARSLLETEDSDPNYTVDCDEPITRDSAYPVLFRRRNHTG